MISKLTIEHKLTTGIAAVFVLMAAMGFLELRAVHSAAEQFNVAVDKNIRKIQILNGIVTAQSELVSAQRGIVLAGFAKNGEEFEANKSAFSRNFATIEEGLAAVRPLLVTDESRVLSSAIRDEMAAWQPHYQDVLRLAAAGDIAGAERVRKDFTAPIYGKIAADARRMVELQNELLAAQKASVEASNASSRWTAVVVLVLCFLTGVSMWLLIRHVSLDLRRTAAKLIEGAEQVASAAVQVSSASQSLAEGATEQAATLEETSASSKEVSSTARTNTESCHAAAQLVTRAQRQFEAANASLDQMVESMNEISSSGTRISKIIRVIDEIAFQTNILALNAAVEAARAGEAGKGFAVVAEEVRNLAQRSATAARDTAALIEESIATSQEGRIRVDQVAAAIKDLAVEAGQVKTLVDQVNAGSEEQTRGVEMIERSLSQIEQVTQRSAASAQESASAAHELTSHSQAVNSIVKQLTALVGEGK